MLNETFGYRLDVAHIRLSSIYELQSTYMQYDRLESERIDILISLTLTYLDLLSEEDFKNLYNMLDEFYREELR